MLPKIRKISCILLITSGILIVMWLVGLALFGWHIRTYQQDKQTLTDAIVVLTGGRNRIREAIELLNQGLAPKLFISGVPEHIRISDIEAMASTHADEQNRIEIGRHATSTIENAEEVAAWCRNNHIRSLRLITSNYHLPRSMAELKNYHLSAQIIEYPVYSENVAEAWWLSWGSFRLIAMEYNKFLIVCLRNLFKGEK